MSDSLEGTTMEFIARMLHANSEAWLPWERESEPSRAEFRQLAVQIIDAAEPIWRGRVGAPGYEYGVRWPLSEEAHGTGKYSTAVYFSARAAREVVEHEPRGEVVRRIKAGEWEVVDDQR